MQFGARGRIALGATIINRDTPAAEPLDVTN
jgi:hypothetical protein